MPIRPIDLQTLLMQMNQVSRDQAVEKEGALLQEAMRGAAEQKRLGESKEAVRRAEEPEAGAEAVGDQGHKGSSRGKKGKPGSEDEEAEGPDEEVVKDPSLGTRIDLSG